MSIYAVFTLFSSAYSKLGDINYCKNIYEAFHGKPTWSHCNKRTLSSMNGNCSMLWLVSGLKSLCTSSRRSLNVKACSVENRRFVFPFAPLYIVSKCLFDQRSIFSWNSFEVLKIHLFKRVFGHIFFEFTCIQKTKSKLLKTFLKVIIRQQTGHNSNSYERPN